jgi:hypothetical protein
MVQMGQANTLFGQAESPDAQKALIVPTVKQIAGILVGPVRI